MRATGAIIFEMDSCCCCCCCPTMRLRFSPESAGRVTWEKSSSPADFRHPSNVYYSYVYRECRGQYVEIGGGRTRRTEYCTSDRFAIYGMLNEATKIKASNMYWLYPRKQLSVCVGYIYNVAGEYSNRSARTYVMLYSIHWGEVQFRIVISHRTYEHLRPLDEASTYIYIRLGCITKPCPTMLSKFLGIIIRRLFCTNDCRRTRIHYASCGKSCP